ncbi:MAG: molybdenum cofactor guanylyltransferase [Burkholderiaceae bacterium]|jgi:molybdopterin-guanine dinucleotide biosynthesis protein A|nr:molybdenum cofactor guanylyltransferase [Burkholderiaceae bacterium]
MTPALLIPSITAVLLAGGQGLRMGGVNKGLQPFGGVPLARNALERLARQSCPPAQVLISANRDLQNYRALGVPVWPDSVPGHTGPLAGFLTGLTHCRTPLLLTLPCDVPRFPLSLCERMAQALQGVQAEIAMVFAPAEEGPARAQPVFCLLRASAQLRDSLAAFLANGGRKVQAWTAQHRLALAHFDAPQDDPRAFANANTLEELRTIEPGG